VLEFGKHRGLADIWRRASSRHAAWAVNKVSDTKSNYFTVTYTNDNANGSTTRTG